MRQQRNLLAKVSRRLLNSGLSVAWDTWREEYEVMRRIKYIGKRCIQRLMMNDLAWGFHQWQDATVFTRKAAPMDAKHYGSTKNVMRSPLVNALDHRDNRNFIDVEHADALLPVKWGGKKK